MTFYSISNEEIWREVRSLSDDLHAARADIDFLKDAGADREKRVRKLEFRYYAVLAAIGLSAVASALAQRALS